MRLCMCGCGDSVSWSGLGWRAPAALDQRTHRYVARRTTEGLSRREIIRCLQRYVARELYQALVSLSPSSSSWPPQGLQQAGQP
jgi:hypothetical protein